MKKRKEKGDGFLYVFFIITFYVFICICWILFGKYMKIMMKVMKKNMVQDEEKLKQLGVVFHHKIN